MMAFHNESIGPGKTPPRLIADLLDYNPRLKRDGYNLMTDPAPKFCDEALNRRSPSDCRHRLIKKDSLHTTKPSNNDESKSTQHVEAMCLTCRCHFSINAVFRPTEFGGEPCSLFEPHFPMHHFILTSSSQSEENINPADAIKYDGLYEWYEYSCSAPNCPIIVSIKILFPRLSKSLLLPIEDSELLEERGIREIQKDPVRFDGERPAEPITALSHLRSYLSDALSCKGDLRKISTRNKKFRISFADDCNYIFEYLDFKLVRDTLEGDEFNTFWRLPRITDNNKKFIEDAYFEITLRVLTQPKHFDMRTFPTPVCAMKHIRIVLGYNDYPERTRLFDADTEEHPYYASLGAVGDFTDGLLNWAYDRQCECDPINKPYYLDCLQDLAQGRGSDDLQTKVVMATSAGDYGLKDLKNAYGLFGISHETTEPDENIIDLYRSYLESTPHMKDEANSCLRIIAKHRNSARIESLANEKHMNFHEALEFLGVGPDTAPEFIEASAVAMFADGDKQRVTLALKTIAEQKPCDITLQRAAVTMASKTGEVIISVIDAYKYLQIPSNTISDEGILNYFQSLHDKASPAFKERLSEAVRVIALERNSSFLLAKLQDPDAEVQASTAEPVGLDNIGNTCYLNSLLQYYYTVKPLRDMIINFDNYRMEINDENLKKKKVGGRQVEKAEIIKAQRFVGELRKLFIKLKTASTSSVRPTKELAALTIFSTQAEQAARKKSINVIPESKTSLAQVWQDQTSSRIFSSPQVIGNEVEMTEIIKEKEVDRLDTSSEATLVDANSSYSEEFKSKNWSPTHIDSNIEEKEFKYMLNSESGADTITTNNVSVEASPSAVEMPEIPPPIPPRNKAGLVITTDESNDSNSVDKLWDFGSQQDVTEVIGNVLFRLQCAITATGYEYPSGEQIDIIRESFFGANTVYTQKSHSLQQKVEAWSYLLVFPAKSMTRSIYEALDISFDEQMVEIDGYLVPQYTSISRLPRIMQFHIQRTAFDQENLRSWKNRTPVTIPETLYLDRYMDDSDDPNSAILRRRRETWIWKRQLAALEARYVTLLDTQADLNVPDALIATQEWISKIQELEIDGIKINPELPELLEMRISEISHEIDQISMRIAVLQQNLKNQFTDMRKHEYKLHALFIHHGEAGGGHYWVYIYDSVHDIWRQYNDEHVTEVRNRDFIFKHETVGGGTPYYVVYVRSSELNEIVNPVFREVLNTETDNTDHRLTNEVPEGFSASNCAKATDEIGNIEYVS
ncbi:BgTH12-02715 [Blumeria graminis f. sp. triticale]|uniref:ubiquitinyl hydrolase 1 n=1 Tax=Blumeria graminis f. sp. triticale TaxID=1689686 RepID=A0A9W4D2R8_BLUGR|nr:BgTH12-02715 [Blumeria graminis f. sp. triticale]